MKNIILKKYRKETNEKRGNWVRTRPYVIFKCFRCKNEIDINEKSYKESVPCEMCRRSLRAEKNFFKKSKEKYGDKFDLSLVDFIDTKTKIKIRCVKHDLIYEILPLVFTGKGYPGVPQKGGCPECAKEDQKKAIKKPIEHYLKVLNEKFPHFQVIAHGEAENNLEKIVLNCSIHGNFKTTLAKIISKESVHLCAFCANEKLPWNTGMATRKTKGTLYLAFIPELEVYKLGVTYRDPIRRCYELGNNVNLIWTLECASLSDAYFLEYTLLQKFRNLRKLDKNDNKYSGYTEYLLESIEKPSKRFIEETLCLKASNSEKLLINKDNSERSLNNIKERATTIS